MTRTMMMTAAAALLLTAVPAGAQSGSGQGTSSSADCRTQLYKSDWRERMQEKDGQSRPAKQQSQGRTDGQGTGSRDGRQGDKSGQASAAKDGKTGPSGDDAKGFRDEIMTLHQAANILARYGEQAACRTVLTAMEDIVERDGKVKMAKTDAGSGDDTSKDQQQAQSDKSGDSRKAMASAAGAGAAKQASDRSRTDEGSTSKPADKARGGVQATAFPQMTGKLRATEILDMEVLNFARESLGSVDDIVLAGEERGGYLIVGHGGILGLGERQIAVPYDKAFLGSDMATIFLDMTQDQLKKLPSFETGDYSWIEDDEWRSENNAFYAGD